MNKELEEAIKQYNELKRNKAIIANIDTNFFFNFTEVLLQALDNSIPKEVIEKFYNGEVFTAKQLKFIKQQQKEYFIHKKVIEDKLKELEKQYEEALDENSTQAFILKCQIEILKEILEGK